MGGASPVGLDGEDRSCAARTVSSGRPNGNGVVRQGLVKDRNGSSGWDRLGEKPRRHVESEEALVNLGQSGQPRLRGQPWRGAQLQGFGSRREAGRGSRRSTARWEGLGCGAGSFP